MFPRKQGRWAFRRMSRRVGQATVEFALVALVLGAIVVGLMALMDVARRNGFVEAGVHSASHVVGTGGITGDALLY